MWTWLFGDSSRCHSSSGNHLGQDYDANLRYGKIILWRIAGQFFRDVRNFWPKRDWFSRFEVDVDKLVAQSSLSIFHCQSLRFLRFCLGKMGDDPTESRRSKIQWCSEYNYFKDLNRIDGQLMKFEWKIFLGLTTMGIFKQIQQMMRELRCEPENFTGRIIFMSKSNDMVWDSKGMMKYVETIQRQFNRMLVESVAVIVLSLGSDLKRSGTELTRSKPDGSCHRIAGQMLLSFSGSRHPVFRCTIALERGQLRSKTSGKKSINTFQWHHKNIELLLQMVISVNQVYGAVANIIEELPVDQRAPGNPLHLVFGQGGDFFISSSSRRNARPWRATGNFAVRTRAKIWNIVRRPEVIQTGLRSRFEIGRNWPILLCSVTKIRKKPIFVPRIYDASRSKRNSYQRVDPKQCTILHRLGQKSLHSLRKIQYWHSCSFFISMSNQILNSNNERFWQICQRSHADPSGRWSFGETRSKSETNAKTVIHKWLGFSSDWTEKMDGHWNAGIKWSLLFSTVEIHHSTTTTPPRSSTKRWWSSPWRWSYSWMPEKTFRQYWTLVRRNEEGIRQCSVLVDWEMDISSGKGWRTKEKVHECGIVFIDSCTFEQFKDIQEVQSILHCKTMLLLPEGFLIVFITSETEKNWGQ